MKRLMASTLVGISLATSALSVQYEIALLPPEVLSVDGMNNHGVIIANVTLSGGTNISTWTKSGGLLSRPLPSGLSGHRFLGSAINDAGDIFGNRKTLVGSGYDDGLTRIGADGSFMRYFHPGGADEAYASYVTEDGAVAGFAVQSSSGSLGYLAWRADGQFHPTFIPGTGEFVRPTSINDAHQIAGATLEGRPVRLEADGSVTYLERLGNEQIAPATINSYGAMVGRNVSLQKIFLWRPDGALDRTIPMAGMFISVRNNDLGHVLVTSVTSTGASTNFVWSESNGLQQLESTLTNPVGGLSITNIRSSNDVGQVVVRGTLNGQTVHALLTPVPEPGTLVVLGVGLVAVLRRRGSRRS